MCSAGFPHCLSLWGKVPCISDSDAFWESLRWALRPVSTQPVISSIKDSKCHNILYTDILTEGIPCLSGGFSFPFQWGRSPYLSSGGWHIDDTSGPTPCHAPVALGGNGNLRPWRALLGLLALLASRGALPKLGSAQGCSGTGSCTWEREQGPLPQLSQPHCCAFPFCWVVTANTDPPALLWHHAELIIAQTVLWKRRAL